MAHACTGRVQPNEVHNKTARVAWEGGEKRRLKRVLDRRLSLYSAYMYALIRTVASCALSAAGCVELSCGPLTIQSRVPFRYARYALLMTRRRRAARETGHGRLVRSMAQGLLWLAVIDGPIQKCISSPRHGGSPQRKQPAGCTFLGCPFLEMTKNP